MSKSFTDLTDIALKNRDKYSEVEQKVGGKQWDVLHRTTGLAGDVGDLLKLVMAKQGLRQYPKATDDALAHELSDCLWSIIVIADELGINLEQAFIVAMDKLQARINEEKTEIVQSTKERSL